MAYKLHSNVFFKKISDDQVNILLANDDNFIFKLNKVAAQVFLFVAEKNMSEENVRTEVLKITNKPSTDVDPFLKEFYKQMLDNQFFIKV